MENKQSRRIILASSSPRRWEILAFAGLEFKAAPSCFNEDSLAAFPPREYVQRLAVEKARCLVTADPGAVIIGADTIVVCEDRVLGKPENRIEAEEILKFCRGKTCEVLTGFAIIDSGAGKNGNWCLPRTDRKRNPKLNLSGAVRRFGSKERRIAKKRQAVRCGVDSTKVKMRNYGDEEIKNYAATGAPLRYAGAFAIQDRDWVESIEGSFFNVVGFPILKVLKLLEDFGVTVSKEKLERIRERDVYPVKA